MIGDTDQISVSGTPNDNIDKVVCGIPLSEDLIDLLLTDSAGEV